jgi:hypothetical protein
MMMTNKDAYDVLLFNFLLSFCYLHTVQCLVRSVFDFKKIFSFTKIFIFELYILQVEIYFY